METTATTKEIQSSDKSGIGLDNKTFTPEKTSQQLAHDALEKIKRGAGRPAGSKNKVKQSGEPGEVVVNNKSTDVVKPNPAATPQQIQAIERAALCLLQTEEIIVTRKVKKVASLITNDTNRIKEFVETVKIDPAEEKSIPELTAIVCAEYGFTAFAPAFFLFVAVANLGARQYGVVSELNDLHNRILEAKKKNANQSSTDKSSDNGKIGDR